MAELFARLLLRFGKTSYRIIAVAIEIIVKISVMNPAMDLFIRLYTSQHGRVGEVRNRIFFGSLSHRLIVERHMAKVGRSDQMFFQVRMPAAKNTIKNRTGQKLCFAHFFSSLYEYTVERRPPSTFMAQPVYAPNK